MVAVKSHMEAAKFVSNVNFVVVRPHSLYLEVFLVAEFVASSGLQFQKRPIFWGYEPSTQIWVITKEMRKYLKNKNRIPMNPLKCIQNPEMGSVTPKPIKRQSHGYYEFDILRRIWQPLAVSTQLLSATII